MSFLHPTYLWALLGLVVPIAIHIWSRKKVRVIKVGSTQFFESVDPKQTNSIKWNELWLLALRLLVISLIVLILGQPRVNQTVQNRPITYLIEPSLLVDERILSLIDSLPEGSIRVLQSGFPDLSRYGRVGVRGEIPNYWQLAQEMEHIPTDSIVVFTRALQKGLKGMRPEMAANVQWVLFDAEKTTEAVIEASLDAEVVTLLKVSGSAQYLGFEKEVVAKESDTIEITADKDSVKIGIGEDQTMLSLVQKAPIRTHIVYEDVLSGQMKYIASAFRAIGSYLGKRVEVRTTLISDTTRLDGSEHLVWLSAKSVPENKGNVLVYRPDSLAGQPIVPGLKKNTYRLTRLLNTENIVSEHVTTRLMPLLDLHPDLREKTRPYDQRTVALNELRPVVSTVSKERKKAQLLDLSPWLWLLLVIALIVERFVAKYRRQ